MDTPARYLVFHGAIVLLLGLLMGGPYGRAINRNAPAHMVQAWRVAHLSIPSGATLMLAVGGVLSAMAAPPSIKWLISVSLIVSSYAFCFALPLAAVVGHRGLSAKGPLSARVVFAGNMLGAGSSVVAAVGLIYAAYVSL